MHQKSLLLVILIIDLCLNNKKIYKEKPFLKLKLIWTSASKKIKSWTKKKKILENYNNNEKFQGCRTYSKQFFSKINKIFLFKEGKQNRNKKIKSQQLMTRNCN